MIYRMFLLLFAIAIALTPSIQAASRPIVCVAVGDKSGDQDCTYRRTAAEVAAGEHPLFLVANEGEDDEYDIFSMVASDGVRESMEFLAAQEAFEAILDNPAAPQQNVIGSVRHKLGEDLMDKVQNADGKQYIYVSSGTLPEVLKPEHGGFRCLSVANRAEVANCLSAAATVLSTGGSLF